MGQGRGQFSRESKQFRQHRKCAGKDAKRILLRKLSFAMSGKENVSQGSTRVEAESAC